MEIERKYLIKSIPFSLEKYQKKEIKQGYVNTDPVIRIRQANEDYILTIKGQGLISREEFELPIDADQFDHLALKLDYPLLYKTRYLIPFMTYIIELDVFHKHMDGLILAEVEFSTLEEANTFTPPEWFGKDVSETNIYHNSYLCQLNSLDDLI